jgi:hypothetical protein
MANALTTDFGYTYDGKLATQLFYQLAVQSPDIRALFRTRTDIKYKEVFHLVNQISRMTVADPGCGTREDTASASIGSKEMEVCNGWFRLSQCTDAFAQTVLEEQTREGAAYYNLQGTALANVIRRLISDALARDLFRVFSFGDALIDLDDDTQEKYYNWCTGLWPSLLADDGYGVHVQTDAISALDQSDGTRALDYLRELRLGAPRILRQWTGYKAFYVTQNVYDNLERTYEDSTLSNGLTARTENGITRLQLHGIDVVPFMAWDDAIEQDGLGNNVRILYAARDNHVAGLLNAADQGVVEQWYDPLTGYNYWQGRPRAGYEYIRDDLQAISIGNVS